MRSAVLAAVLAACGSSARSGGAVTGTSASADAASTSASPSSSVDPTSTSRSADPAGADPTSADPTVVPGEPLGSPVTNSPTTSSDTVPDANEVIVALRPRFRRCYELAREGGPAGAHVSGMVSAGLRLTKAGKVASVSVTRRYGIPYSLVDCIVAELKTAVFKPLPEEAIIQVPVRFALPGED